MADILKCPSFFRKRATMICPMHLMYWAFILPNCRSPPISTFQIRKKCGGKKYERL